MHCLRAARAGPPDRLLDIVNLMQLQHDLTPRIIGHRGAAVEAPENTISSIRKAAERGAVWVEFDVSLTRDGIPVLLHDQSLKRTTGRSGLIRDVTFADLRGLEVGSWFAVSFAGEPVPSLEEALAVILEEGLLPNVEIKGAPGAEVETAKAVVAVLHRCWPKDSPSPLLSSFSRLSLASARVEAPDLPRALIAHRLPGDWAEALAVLECVSLHLNGKYLTAERVSLVKRAGYGVGAFTVNSGSRAVELAGWGVDSIITDDPASIIAAFTKPSGPSLDAVSVHASG